MFEMTSTLIRNLFAGHATRLYPAEKREPFASVRGRLFNNSSLCILCGVCERICPSRCLAVDRDKRTWTYHPFSCVSCGACVDKCPTKSLFMETQYRKPGRTKVTESVFVPEREKEKKTKSEQAALEKSPEGN